MSTPRKLVMGACTLMLACTQGPPPDDHAARAVGRVGQPLTFWNAGIADNPLSACLVLSPASGASSDERERVQRTVLEWTFDSALQVSWAPSDLRVVTIDGVDYQTTCSWSTDASGNAQFVEDFRAYLDDAANYPNAGDRFPEPGTKLIPGCTAREDIGTQAYRQDGTPEKDGDQFVPQVFLWAMSPQVRRDEGPGCLYNAHLLRGAQRNNYLHEFGHALGFRHEHERLDATCERAGDDVSGYMTRYDVNSVMHYVRTAAEHGCVAPGNWGEDGLTALDFFGASMLFPRSLFAGVWGALGFVEGGSSHLLTAWEDRGAYVDAAQPAQSALRNVRWTLDGALRATTPSVTLQGLGAGTYPLRLEFEDMWNRHHVGDYTLEVTSTTEAAARTVSTAAVAVML